MIVGIQFAPIVHAFNGAFTPQNVEALGVHSDMLLKTIQTTKLGKHGNRPLSFEEHTIRKWARLAADIKEGGHGIFDATMDHKPAAGLITSDVYSRIAFTSIKHSCDAVIEALHDNNTPINISRMHGLFQLSDLNSTSRGSSTSPLTISSSSTDSLFIDSDSDSSYIDVMTQSSTYGGFSQA